MTSRIDRQRRHLRGVRLCRVSKSVATIAAMRAFPATLDRRWFRIAGLVLLLVLAVFGGVVISSVNQVRKREETLCCASN